MKPPSMKQYETVCKFKVFGVGKCFFFKKRSLNVGTAHNRCLK